jgi:hypothetical protein
MSAPRHPAEAPEVSVGAFDPFARHPGGGIGREERDRGGHLDALVSGEGLGGDAPGHIFRLTSSGDNAYFEGLDISGAQYDNAIISAEQGKAIGGSADNLQVWATKLHDNENQGAGSLGPGAEFHWTEIYDNGMHESASDNTASDEIPGDEPASAAGIKSGDNFYVYDSYIHHNYWDGIWCDVNCPEMESHDTLYVNNGKAGIHFEVSAGPAIFEGNTFRDNGEGQPWGTHTYPGPRAGIIMSGSGNATVGCQANPTGCTSAWSANKLADLQDTSNFGQAIYTKTDIRTGYPSATNPIYIRGNILNGDTLVFKNNLSCNESVIFCTNPNNTE